MNHILNKSRPSIVIAAIFIAAIALNTCQPIPTQEKAPLEKVELISNENGHKLQINGADFMIFGMNWDYYPPGTNYSYSLWDQPDSFIIQALDYEMNMLVEMGVNTIRQYAGIPPRWVQYIYENYAIYTILNHPLARYGYTLDSTWYPSNDYASEQLRSVVLNELSVLLDEFKNTPGVLMWLLGNENNYGLFWESAQTADIPMDEAPQMNQAEHLYTLVNEAVNLIHSKDNKRPVGLANGDVQYIDLIAKHVKDLDVFGTNVYRGESFGDLFQVVEDKLGIPVLFTEFGADAFNAVTMEEDQHCQTKYLLANWEEIYLQSYGNGQVGNSIGGCTFQFSDGLWKFDQQKNLSEHDSHASWSNGGYSEDYVPGKNNMNEEWFGICAKGPVDSQGLYPLIPRLAYNALDQIHEMNPLDPEIDSSQVIQHFSSTRKMINQ